MQCPLRQISEPTVEGLPLLSEKSQEWRYYVISQKCQCWRAT